MRDFRKSTEADVPRIMEIIEEAQAYLRELGVDQWQNGYPDEAVILEDIKHGYSYVLMENEQVIGTAALSFDGEKTYEEIHDGGWLTNEAFGVVHRIAVDPVHRNSTTASEIMKQIENIAVSQEVFSIKIDTHEDNKPMQKYLLKNGFVYCGVIYLLEGAEKGDKRLAYEKVLLDPFFSIYEFSMEEIVDPFGIIEGQRYEFLLYVDVDKEDELYREKGIYIKVLYAVNEEEQKMIQYQLIENETDAVLDFVLDEEEEAYIASFCQKQI